MSSRQDCPACGGGRIEAVRELSQIPTNSCLLHSSREDALSVSRDDFLLALCLDCGLYFNASYDSGQCVYNQDYEETQAYSAAFRQYLEKTARDLVSRRGLYGKKLLEIGCGKGEFLSLLCELGDNRCVGYDPAFRKERHPNPDLSGLEFRSRMFTRDEPRGDWDAIFNRMTLEHVAEVGDFLSMLRESFTHSNLGLCYTQVPNCDHIFQQGLICDLIYEHCSYFTRSSLTSALQQAGFAVQRVDYAFGNQHLAIEATPGVVSAIPEEADEEALLKIARAFNQRATVSIVKWNRQLEEFRAGRQRVVVWGSGSKATAFLDQHHWGSELEAVVDINPNRQGAFVSGSGHEIVAPTELMPGGRYPEPDVVVVMNPIYLREIGAMLSEMGLNSSLMAL